MFDEELDAEDIADNDLFKIYDAVDHNSTHATGNMGLNRLKGLGSNIKSGLSSLGRSHINGMNTVRALAPMALMSALTPMEMSLGRATTGLDRLGFYGMGVINGFNRLSDLGTMYASYDNNIPERLASAYNRMMLGKAEANER